jgi:hypothetical protein
LPPSGREPRCSRLAPAVHAPAVQAEIGSGRRVVVVSAGHDRGGEHADHEEHGDHERCCIDAEREGHRHGEQQREHVLPAAGAIHHGAPAELVEHGRGVARARGRLQWHRGRFASYGHRGEHVDR